MKNVTYPDIEHEQYTQAKEPLVCTKCFHTQPKKSRFRDLCDKCKEGIYATWAHVVHPIKQEPTIKDDYVVFSPKKVRHNPGESDKGVKYPTRVKVTHGPGRHTTVNQTAKTE